MHDEANNIISEWKPLFELRPIEQNISDMGYKRDPIEVTVRENEIWWRINQERFFMPVPPFFDTRIGFFNNYNHGEFFSGIKRTERTDPFEDVSDYSENTETSKIIEGNYCLMFDSGSYAIAVSNLMHMGLGLFKIIRIDENLTIEVLYDNDTFEHHTHLEYAGSFKRGNDWYVIGRGLKQFVKSDDGFSTAFDDSLLFKISENGEFKIIKSWKMDISSPNSYVVVGNHIYYGQNHMVTRLDLLTGKTDYFTNKSDSEIRELQS
ncbi:hypothetical protein [Butyrivibrio sp. VCD2006]|uniref:hypothetical protein n=1 Tax=Butyrivibrio sp. VCD2006 TaxID=1280664 RepID=UPI000413E052|nr:hypothetical protein [Butyrivibrio sp. VCD2006]